jgi:hypothetical protein
LSHLIRYDLYNDDAGADPTVTKEVKRVIVKDKYQVWDAYIPLSTNGGKISLEIIAYQASESRLFPVPHASVLIKMKDLTLGTQTNVSGADGFWLKNDQRVDSNYASITYLGGAGSLSIDCQLL